MIKLAEKVADIRVRTPVVTNRAKAVQATTLKRRAATRVASGETRRSAGTSAARVSCPPTHTVAASTCTVSTSACPVSGSMIASVHPARRRRRYRRMVSAPPSLAAGRCLHQ
jgi:hypothetical protein